MGRTRRRCTEIARCVWCVILLGPGQPGAVAQEAVAPRERSHIVALDPKAAELVESGKQRSATLRRLIEDIERSDLLVWVEAGNLQHPGQLQFAAATPRRRYLRVGVHLPGLENDLLALLAHELQHAVEIAGAPEVRDSASLLRFYRRIGHDRRVGGGFEAETSSAQRTAVRVLNELLDARARR